MWQKGKMRKYVEVQKGEKVLRVQISKAWEYVDKGWHLLGPSILQAVKQPRIGRR